MFLLTFYWGSDQIGTSSLLVSQEKEVELMNTWQISAADPPPQRNKKKTTGVDEVIEDMKIEGKLRGRV